MSTKFIIHLYTNKLHFILPYLKQHIKIVVLFKSPNNSPTCFGQFLTILREIFISFTSVTKDELLYSNNQAREGTQNQHKQKYKRQGPSDQKVWQKHVGELLGLLNNTTILMCCF